MVQILSIIVRKNRFLGLFLTISNFLTYKTNKSPTIVYNLFNKMSNKILGGINMQPNPYIDQNGVPYNQETE